MKRLLLLAFISVSTLLTIGAMNPQFAFAQADASSQEACQTIKAINPNDTGCGASNGQVTKIIRIALQILSVAAGIIAVIMIIVAGLKYVTSQGDASKISSAKNSLIYAIVGIVIVAFAQIIVQFVVRTSDRGYAPTPAPESSERQERNEREQRFESAFD
jgi:hypothetical protein